MPDELSNMPRAAIAACLLLAACASPTIHGQDETQVSSPGRAECSGPNAQEIALGVSATNSARAQAGLSPVRANARLARAAAQQACDMAQRGLMTHAGSHSSGPAQRVKALGYAPRITAENIAAGPYDIHRVLQEWNGSGGHLANILIPQVRDFGIGHAIGPDGRTHFWSAVYAAPSGG